MHGQGQAARRTASTSRSLARKTPGFTGADLANVLNEAALLTARSNAQLIDNRALDEAIDRVIAGPQRRTRVMRDKEKLITAYHEGGHALAAAAMNNTDPVTKITILPRGRALGYTMVLPLEDKYSVTRNELLDQLAYAMGGRVAEEIVFHDPTTGASNDIEKATAIARKMVTEYGMSADVGPVKLGSASRRDVPRPRHGPPARLLRALAERVDTEVRAAHRAGARRGLRRCSTPTATSSTGWPLELLEKETLDHIAARRDLQGRQEAARRARSGSPATSARSRRCRPIDDARAEGARSTRAAVDGGISSGEPRRQAQARARTAQPRPATA